MYQPFFDLRRPPFPASPDPSSLVVYGNLGTQLGELAACLTAGHGIAVMTGPPGSGKTLCGLTLVRDLTESLIGVCLRTGQFEQPGDLLKALLHGLGRPYNPRDDQDLRLAVSDAIHGLPSPTEGILLSVDEAHLLGWNVLEELRGLTNYDAEGRPLVRLLLAGHCSLDEKLADPRMEGLYQRVRAQVRLEPLTRGESQDYLRTRLRFAGGDPATVMTADTFELLATVCDGSPRCLNHLADASLQRAAWTATRPVTRREVLEALTESRRLPLQFSEPVTAIDTPDQCSEPDLPTSPVILQQTDDGLCSVEVGATMETTQNWPTEDASTNPAEPVAENSPVNDPTETFVEVTEFDIVLPEPAPAHEEHNPPRPHTGLFSRLRNGRTKASDAAEE